MHCFSEEQLEALCVDILLGGADTTGAVLSFAILFLALDPQLQKLVHEERDRNVPRDRLPTLDDRPK